MKEFYFKVLKKLFKKNFFKIYFISKKFSFKIKNFNEIVSLNRNESYEYFLNFFHFKSEKFIVDHRNYFKNNRLGFGEDAFHAMWSFIFSEFKPNNILEIGVYRGQTLSLFQMLSNHNNINSNIWGITPLTSDADEVSEYEEINYYEDIKRNFEYFNLIHPNILKALSTDKEAIDFIDSLKWDLIYIDGSHDHEVVAEDVKNSIRNLAPNGIMVMDDSSLYTDFSLQVKGVSIFKGHPGPSKVYQALLNNKEVQHLFGVGHNNIFIKK